MGAGHGQLFVVSGPSGSGKSTIVAHVVRTVPDMIFSVSYTTRPPRTGEQDGRDYRFVTRAAFEQMLARSEFLEHAEVFGNYYGTHQSVLAEAARQQKDVVLDIDVEGTRQVKSRLADAVAVLLLPPSAQELEQRLRARALDTAEGMLQRLERARHEIENYGIYDYLVVNRVLAETCAAVEAIVQAERLRRAGRPPGSGEARDWEARAAAARRDNNKSQVSAILETFGAQRP